MPIHHAVMALLSEGESYGYELKASFEAAMGPQWGTLNIGHLYQILDRLVRDGYVTKRHVPQNDRPDKTVYRLTRPGRSELEHWLQEPFVRQSGYRDDFFLKLFAASLRGRSDLHQVIRIQRRAYLSELKTLTNLKSTKEDEPLVELLIEAAIKHTEANLSLIDVVERSIERLAVEGTDPARLDEHSSGDEAGERAG